ncbi:zinc finger protein 771-like, partial [Plectropomus leopardus]|uniref:zinc finger protein 771-like n=1 Tax=Plectropomus leopardus TaxID=160734 RepID=UPI001C4BF8AA
KKCYLEIKLLFSADVQQLLVVQEEVPADQQEWSSSVDQEDPEPPYIKEEQEELWIGQEGEQLQRQEEADIIKFPFAPVNSDDDEKPQTSQLYQRLTEPVEIEADWEDCGGPDPDWNSDPDAHLQPETDDSDGDWTETREYQAGFNFLKNYKFHVADSRSNSDEKPFSCSECGKRYYHKTHLKRHMRTHTGEKPFTCSVCGKKFADSGNLKIHMRTHTGEKPFCCSECGKRFNHKTHLKRHMSTHTGEKPFSCSVCKKSFSQSGNLHTHMRSHTGEKPFSCSVCKRSFKESGSLQKHMISHTGEKSFCCSVCNQRFTWRIQLINHQRAGCQPSQTNDTQTEANKDGEPPASSSAHQIRTEVDAEDCGGPEPARDSDPDRHVQPETEDKTGDSPEPETERS